MAGAFGYATVVRSHCGHGADAPHRSERRGRRSLRRLLDDVTWYGTTFQQACHSEAEGRGNLLAPQCRLLRSRRRLPRRLTAPRNDEVADGWCFWICYGGQVTLRARCRRTAPVGTPGTAFPTLCVGRCCRRTSHLPSSMSFRGRKPVGISWHRSADCCVPAGDCRVA